MCRAIILPPHHYPFGISLHHGGFKLGEMARHFEIEIYQRHTALGDAMVTAMICQQIVSRLEKVGRALLRDLVKTPM